MLEFVAELCVQRKTYTLGQLILSRCVTINIGYSVKWNTFPQFSVVKEKAFHSQIVRTLVHSHLNTISYTTTPESAPGSSLSNLYVDVIYLTFSISKTKALPRFSKIMSQ